MKTADLISSYLNNEMTPEQERRFLLSVAASDSLRLSLKSHFMLDRIVVTQALDAHVPDRVRENILAQAAASVAGGSPAVHHAQAEPTVHAPSRLGTLFGRGALLALLVTGGYAAGYMTHPGEGSVPARQQSVAPIVRPADAVGADASAPMTAPSIEPRTTTVAAQSPAVITGDGASRSVASNRTSASNVARRENGATVPAAVAPPSQTVPSNPQEQHTVSSGDAPVQPAGEQVRPPTVTVITTVTKPGASEHPKQPDTEDATTP